MLSSNNNTTSTISETKPVLITLTDKHICVTVNICVN